MLSIPITAAVGTDMTLVWWEALTRATRQGGSALTHQCGDQFGGIVFGEGVPGKWLADSNFCERTPQDRQSVA